MRILRPWLLLVWLVAVACQATVLQSRTRLEDEGVVYLYLQPLAEEAGRLRFDIGGISALHRDGRELPLPVSLREVKGRDVGRQRLLAAGPLAAGAYAGFAVRTTRATLRGEGGESALLVPEGPTRIDFTFAVRRREGSVILLALKYGESVEAGFGFRPTFAVYAPERPPVALMGFVANSRSHDVTVFNKKSLQVFDVIATGRGPSGMALDQRARKVYVALSGEDAVEIIDVMAGKIVDRIMLTPGDEPAAVALTPDGTTLLSANRGSNTVSVIETGSRLEAAKIPVGNGPRSIAVDRAGRRAFVFNTLSSTVSAIDIPSRSVVRTIPTDPGPVQGQFNRRGDRLYVVHEAATHVTAITPHAMTVTGRFPIRSAMDAIRVDPNTDLVYLGGRRELVVGVYDPFSFVPVDFIEAGGAVASMTTDADENALYLALAGGSRVRASHRIGKRLLGELDTGDGPAWISVMGEN